MRTRSLAAVAGVLALVATGAAPAQAARPVTPAPLATIASWQMDEAPGAPRMLDSSGNDLFGDNGDEVVTGVAVQGSTGYRFARLKPNTPPAHPEHNVIVPHAPVLNPGNRAEYAVEVRYRTTNPFGNIVQKGQAGARGGYWKIQLPQGEASCLFRGPDGETNAIRSRGIKINDGAWHTVRCEATPTEARLYIDGAFIGRNRGTTGVIANTEPVYVGGMGFCDQVKITCDYFGGDIDYVRLEGSS